MNKKYEDDKNFSAFLTDLYIGEAEVLEAELFADGAPKEVEMSEGQVRASYEKLKQRLIAEGAYRSDSVKKKSHRLQTLGKVAGIAVVSALCVFAASMTSEANRAYVIDRVGYLTGNRSKITVDNDEENEWASMDESEAVEDIFNMLGISLPRMLYRPDGFVYTSYLIDDSASVAELEYDYEGNTIVLMADKEVELKGSQLYSVHGESITVSDMDGMEFEVSITCSADDKEDTPLYTAAWVRDEVLYQFTGRIELDELKKIIQKMQFV